MSFVKAIIGIVVAVVMITAVLIPTIKGVNTTDWSTGEVALFGMGTTFAVLGLIYSIAAAFGLV
jgi:preprotein translocase subunit SecG